MAVEFRGCRKLVYAEITKDDNEVDGGYVVGPVKELAPVGEINKTVETSTETKHYDNKPALNISGEGPDTVTFSIAIPKDEVLADITGRVYDAVKKMFIEAPRKQKYFAVGYIIGEVGEGEEEKYVWRHKGTFNIPDEISVTKDNSTTSNNMSLIYTGIYTEHEFTNGGGTGVKEPSKSIFMRAKDVTEEKFFETVTTPDTELAGMGG